MLSLNDPITKLRLVGPTGEKALRHLGILTVADLLRYFPRTWQDLSEIKTISQIQPNETVNLKATVKKLSGRYTPRRHLHLTEALLSDETGNILAVWFNQPFLRNSLRQGGEYYFSGKAQLYQPSGKGSATLQLQNPSFEMVKADTIHTAGIIPIYELTEGITQKQLRYWLKQAFVLVPKLTDYLPPAIRRNVKLPELRTAIRNIHFPGNQKLLDEARKRLAFDELFLFQLALQSFKRKLQELPAPLIPFDIALTKKFVDSLPWKLTHSQRLAAWEILQDLQNPHPMNRLLEGEVGSGKTVVAGLAMLAAANAGWQSVLLAPTEILAWQHYQTLRELFKDANLNVAILTRSHKQVLPPLNLPLSEGEKQEGVDLPNAIAAGRIKIIVGTHALLQDKIKFQKIGLLVVDEQHRFGVKQRSQLQNVSDESLVPHLLSMTATPIPRTLVLAFYGDLDISQLRELPLGRKKVITRLVEPDKRPLAYEFIRKQLQAGRQVYVVTPLIEESSPYLPSPTGGEGLREGVKAATQEVEKLKVVFPEFSVGLLHGRMKGEEKKQIMADFKAGKLQILVTTTVIEVGVDVANATIMLVENAERFGLAQLHQLRGRVGRSDLQSYCLLFAESSANSTKNRLEAVVKSTDGFELAEKDLELRGPGEVMGTRQSGYIPFKIAKLSDKRLIKLAKQQSEILLAKDPRLDESPVLKTKVAILAKNAHLE